MATDTVDDTSYVDIYGVRVTNRWIYTEAGTDNAPNSEGGWYYLDAAGKAVSDGWKTINNKKYYFDSDGTMQYAGTQTEAILIIWEMKIMVRQLPAGSALILTRTMCQVTEMYRSRRP